MELSRGVALSMDGRHHCAQADRADAQRLLYFYVVQHAHLHPNARLQEQELLERWLPRHFNPQLAWMRSLGCPNTGSMIFSSPPK
ncbi:hypothetical protein OAO87_00755 [bacterium]|nr:hypothetical protein [bacterium]